MTEHTVTVERTIDEEETVYTCDYCGLGDDAGEMMEFNYERSDGGFAYAPDEIMREMDGGDETIPDLHYHVSCLPDVVSSESQAESITLANQYNRRTGDVLLFVVTAMSLPFFAITAGSIGVGWYLGGLLGLILSAFGILFGLFTIILSRREARNTLEEFST